jgi:Raf kinase inhibitor-like YbhB/YbcL family protein
MKAYFILLPTLLLMTVSSWAQTFTVSSKAFRNQHAISEKYVFNGFGCSGKNVSPDLEWRNIPPGTKSFAVTIYDPDAPTGSGWWHWTLFNIPASITKLPEGASMDKTKLPDGSIEGRTDFGKSGYGGPCPPPGDKPHHYILTVYALKVPLINLDANAPGAMLGYYMSQATVGKAQVTALYGRK